MAGIWVADDEPNRRLSLYARGNSGEVFPNVVSALTGTLVGGPLGDAQTELFVEGGILRPEEATGPSCGSGVFGGYLYLNATTFRLFGVRTPGLSWRDADTMLLGAVTDLPDYEASSGDRNLRATWAIMRYSARVLRRPDLGYLDDARADAQRWLSTMPDLATATDETLLAWLEPFPDRLATSMQRLGRAAMLIGAPRGMLDQLLERADAPAGLANAMVSGVGDIDSARLAQRLWALGRMVAADAELTAAFDAGLDDIAERTRDSAFADALADFLDEHGHRGNDEYELATLPWVMNPAPVFTAIDRLRHAPPERDPVVVGRRLATDAREALERATALVARPLRPLVRHMTEVARLGSIGRERAKDILVLENLGARRVLHELVRRAADRGGEPDARDAFCVTYEELPAYLASPGDFTAIIAERAARRDYLDARVPPEWFDGQMSDPATWPLRADVAAAPVERGRRIEGIAVSGGTASGPARVIDDPGDPRGLQPGEVLVCPITDPSWTPLFLGAVAVVCETGAVYSHAAIVARELGIPAVLSVPGITGIADGTVVHVDGDGGVVSVDP